MSNDAGRVRVPYWVVVNVPSLATVLVRPPTGYVFADMSFTNLASSNIGISFSTDREQRTFVPYAATDLSDGGLPTSFDAFTNFVFVDNAQTPNWTQIESSRIQSIQLHNASAWTSENIHIYGVYVKDVCVQV